MKRVKVIRDDRGYSFLNGNEYDVVATMENGNEILIQLTQYEIDIGNKGHTGEPYTLDDGEYAGDSNFKNVFWVRKSCVEEIEAKYPKYMITLDSSSDIIVVNFTNDMTGTVVFCSNKSVYTKGNYQSCWGMSWFRNLTNEEYNKYIKQENYKMNYKMVKQISGKALLNDDACVSEFKLYVDKFGPYTEIAWTEEVEKYVLNVNARLTFLLERGYIEKITTLLNSYDSFKHYYLTIDNDLWRVRKARGSKFNLQCLTKSNDNSWSDENKSWEDIHSLIDSISLKKSEVKAFDTFLKAVEWYKTL